MRTALHCTSVVKGTNRILTHREKNEKSTRIVIIYYKTLCCSFATK